MRLLVAWLPRHHPAQGTAALLIRASQVHIGVGGEGLSERQKAYLAQQGVRICLRIEGRRLYQQVFTDRDITGNKLSLQLLKIKAR